MFDNKTILITGGTGSFGKQFIETVLNRYTPNKIIIYSRDELKQFEMQSVEPFASNRDVLRWFIGDVRDEPRLRMAMEDVDIVVHAAALKQVPAVEYNPFEAVKTNIMGAQNIINACMGSNVQRVIALSTDKAAAPINLYGATKLASDKLFIAANNHRGKRDIRFSTVRYGNVMGSRGSVIPFFQKKAAEGVIPITDERMTRFNITLQEGVDFVISCFGHMQGGETFVPKIPSYRIVDVAEAVDPRAKIEVVGIRPGEKLHEEMITQTDSLMTLEFEDYFVILPSSEQGEFNESRRSNGTGEGKMVADGFNYSSDNNPDFLSVEDIALLIKSEL